MSDDHRDLGALIREALPTHTAPPALRQWARDRAREMVDVPDGQSLSVIIPTGGTRWRSARHALYAAGILAAFLVGWRGEQFAQSGRRSAGDRQTLVAQLVDSHVRSLMLQHLTDVPSTDQHTVKPWFAGKVDFAPRVVDLGSAGFPLVGGRLEYVEGHPVAALVYGRRKHVINLFQWPMTSGADESTSQWPTSYHGFTLRHWVLSGMTYWAVSDVSASDVNAFQRAYLSAP